jgi:hypothetical protein
MILDLTAEERVLLALAKNNPAFISIVRKVCQQINDDHRAIADAIQNYKAANYDDHCTMLAVNRAVNNLNEIIRTLT